VTVTRYPRAEWRPLPEHDKQPHIVPTQAIVHSIVGSAKSAWNYFNTGTNLESHLILPKQGVPWQCMDLDRQGDANYHANRRPDGTGAHSMETEDNGHPDDDPWTDSQLAEIIAWFNWECDTFGIPRRVCRTPDDPGIGFHSLFGAPSEWTPSRGKTCPGRIRIQQFHDIIVPAVLAPQEDDDMGPAAFVVVTYYAILGRRPESLQTIAKWVEMIQKANDGGNSFISAVANSDEAKAREAALREHAKADAPPVDRVRSDEEILAVVRKALG